MLYALRSTSDIEMRDRLEEKCLESSWQAGHELAMCPGPRGQTAS